ncbi:hypothetical protein C8D92_11054 [Tamilnaduibacter salinus]|uniref:DsrE/DsrF/DsrH-like protein n=1 Tax=Tamilnaduibacter salinus TaxID=1484056 RepID=A0A2A2I002_9GAMM|nr:hypothetical protein [Tamilnaduibacter salinus]PAV24738.1 hypothetical protein CF392_14510 [Tamilnaduibacter salinus]PVY70024.1 hypothetical protein C8D92_11054 [Tamilnaduibacter salinus]
MKTTIRKLMIAALFVAAPFSLQAENHGPEVEDVLVILSSDSPQTQGMAMVLSNTMAKQGADVDVLLCDQAGDLALRHYEGEALNPKGITPGQMLRSLLKKGGSAQVCALYLPNSHHQKTDLLDGVAVAMPDGMSGQMLDSNVRVFTF